MEWINLGAEPGAFLERDDADRRMLRELPRLDRQRRRAVEARHDHERHAGLAQRLGARDRDRLRAVRDQHARTDELGSYGERRDAAQLGGRLARITHRINVLMADY